MIELEISKRFPCDKKTSADITDQRKLSAMAVKLFLLGSLAWDYADTCCNIAASLRISETKRLCRAIRELKRDYDRFRNRHMRDDSIAKETELAMTFENLCQTHFARLNYGVSADKSVCDLNKDYLFLIKAVNMALTVLDTMSLYAKECDMWIISQGVQAHSILADHFVRLASLLPHFAGDCSLKSEARMLTSKILLHEIKNIEIYDNDGKVQIDTP